MRKTLLIAAAALAAGVISSQAQAVYSQNVVGYVNLPLTNGVFALVCPAVDADGTGTNNTVSTIFTTPAIGDTVYAYNGTGYDTLNYKVVASGRAPNITYTTNWFNGSTVAASYKLNPGQSVFYLPVANETATLAGTVMQGTNMVNTYFPAANQFQLLSSQVPIAGGLTSVLGYTPTIGDTVYIYDNGGYDTFNYKVVASGRAPNITYTTNWFNGSTVSEPVINVGQGFWLLPVATTNWVQNFIVQ